MLQNKNGEHELLVLGRKEN